MPKDLRLSRGQLDTIINHSRSCKPEEACGILAGDLDGTVRQVYTMENIEHSQTLYMMDSQEQFRVFDEMEKNGLELVAIFHSHPHSDPVPSARDCELAFYPESLYLILSLQNDKPVARSFHIVDSKVEPVDIIVHEDP